MLANFHLVLLIVSDKYHRSLGWVECSKDSIILDSRVQFAPQGGQELIQYEDGGDPF